MEARSAMIGPSTGNVYAGYNQGMTADWEAESAVRRNYLVNVIVYRCIQIRANAVASLPFRAGKNPLEPNKIDLDAPLARLLGPPPYGPNPEFSAQQLIAWSLAQKLITGRFGWEIEWSQAGAKGQVTALWPLISQYIRPIATKGREKAADGQPRYFKAFEYNANPAQPKTLSSRQMFYEWTPAQHDIHQAESPLQAARMDVAIAVKQSIYDNAFLDNDARPAGLLVTSQFEDREDYDAFETRLNDKYGGPSNAGKAMVVEQEGDDQGNVAQSINWINLGISQKDADFFKRYEQVSKNIAIALGVPFSKLDASARTFSNAEEEDQSFETLTVINDARTFESAVNRRLAPLLGPEIGWFDLSSLKVMRKRTNYNPVDPLTAADKGYISINEAREALGEEALEDKRADVIAALEEPEERPNVIEGEVVEPVPELEPAAPTKPDPEIAPKRAQDQPERGVNDEPRSPATIPDPVPAVDHEARRAKLYSNADDEVTSLEREWERQFRALFADQAVAVAERLGGKRGRQAMARAAEDETEDQATLLAEGVFTYAFWQAKTEQQTSRMLDVLLILALRRLLNKFDASSFSINNPPGTVRTFLVQKAASLAKQVTTTTQNQLRDALREGLAAGEDNEALVARSNAVFDAAAETRAPLIGVNEVFGASNTITRLGADALPKAQVGGKEWITRRDDRVRVSHKRVDGRAIPLDERFDVAGFEMEGPHDPLAPADLVIGCRCLLNILSKEEMNERGELPGYVRVEELTRKLLSISGALP